MTSTQTRPPVPARRSNKRVRRPDGPTGRLRRRWRDRRILRHRPAGRSLVALVAVALVVVASAVVVLATPVLSVRTVTVRGADEQTAAVVRELADIPMGVPLARVDTDAAAARLRALAALATVEIDRSWPSTVEITVTSRQPVAVVEVAGLFWLTDASGVLFAQVSDAPKGTPRLEVENPGPRDATTRSALAVLAVLPADILARVGRVVATSPDDVTLKMTGGRTIVWGSAEDSEQKALALAAVFGQEAGTIDVSSPDAVVLR